MPTIGNLPTSDVRVTFPSGEVRTVNMLVLLAQTQDAEAFVNLGFHLARNHSTIKALRDRYELDWFNDGPVRTWAQAAKVLRFLFTELDDAREQALAEMES